MFEYLKFKFRCFFDRDREYYKFLNKIFGIYPNNIELYKLALIHRSASVFLDDGSSINNERLEFLGDAVLEAVVSDFLFIEFPDEKEGFLTQFRSRIVNRATLNQLAIDLGIDRHIIAQYNVAHIQKHVFGDAMEALIGAMYLDKGYNCVNRLFINNIIRHYIDIDSLMSTESDFKSRLIEWGQQNKKQILFHTVHSKEYTPQMPLFDTIVQIEGHDFGHGHGSSKKEAEQMAACITSRMLSDKDFEADLGDISTENL